MALISASGIDKFKVALLCAPSVAMSESIGTISETAFSIEVRIRSANCALERKGTTRVSLKVTAEMRY